MPRKVMAALVNLYFIRFNCSVLQALKHRVQILKLSFPAVLEESVRNTSCQVYLPAAQGHLPVALDLELCQIASSTKTVYAIIRTSKRELVWFGDSVYVPEICSIVWGAITLSH